MIRRQKSMRFLGGFYAFPGGKVDPADGVRGRARPLPRHLRGRRARAPSRPRTGSRRSPSGSPPRASCSRRRGCCVGCDADGGRVDTRGSGGARPRRAAPPRAGRRGGAASARCSRREGWYLDLAALPLPLALHHAAVEPDPLHRALLPGPACPPGQEPAPASARRPPRASGSIPAEGYRRFLRGRDADGRARRLRARVHRAASTARRRSGPRTSTGATSSTASSTASRRPASTCPRARGESRRALSTLRGDGQCGGPLRRRRRSTEGARRAAGARCTPAGPRHLRRAPAPDRSGRRTRLRARGVEPEQRVAILLPDGPAWAATFFAALQARRGGGPAQHAARRRRELRADPGRLPAAVVVADPRAAGRGAARTPRRRSAPRAIDFDTLRGPARPARRLAARAGRRRRDGLLALHLRDDRLAQGGRALPPHAARRAATTLGRARRRPPPTGSSPPRSSSSPTRSATRS